MIGQYHLQGQVEYLIENNRFPRFSIFVGPKGSGKKTFVSDIVKKIPDAVVVNVGLSVADIRAAIESSYKLVTTGVRVIFDADKMSNAAKNALLKVTEEPPNNAYFIMTLEDENNTLETIKSRATIFYMDSYTPDEIYQYAREFTNYTLHDNEWDIIKNVCDTPGDVNLLGLYPTEFYDYVELVVDNIARVSVANAFKIPDRVALKDDAEGYDLRLFWKVFMKVCMDNKKYRGVRITSKYLQQLRITGINKQQLIDSWILEIRELWK